MCAGPIFARTLSAQPEKIGHCELVQELVEGVQVALGSDHGQSGMLVRELRGADRGFGVPPPLPAKLVT